MFSERSDKFFMSRQTLRIVCNPSLFLEHEACLNDGQARTSHGLSRGGAAPQARATVERLQTVVSCNFKEQTDTQPFWRYLYRVVQVSAHVGVIAEPRRS